MLKNVLRELEDSTNGNVVLLSRSSNPSGSYLSLKDIDALIDIVSKLESLTLIAQLNPVVAEIKELLGLNSVTCGAYCEESCVNIILASCSDKDMELELERRLKTEASSSTTMAADKSERYFKVQEEGFYFYIFITLDEYIDERAEQIMNRTLPALFKVFSRLNKLRTTFQNYGLTDREQEVANWIIEGKDNWSISKILNISERTVKFHNSNIFKKLNVGSKAEIICMHYQIITNIYKEDNKDYCKRIVLC